MTFTKKEEDVLKKIVEIEKKKNEWNALSKTYLDAVRAATRAEETKQQSLRDQINSKHQERVALEAELKSLIEA